jgi:hypothetical protein
MPIVALTPGASSAAISGSVTPAIPPRHSIDDILFCIIESRDNVAPTMPVGWTLLYSFTSGVLHRATLFWKREGASETDPLVTHTAGDVIIARIIGFNGCIKTGNPISKHNVTANSLGTEVIASSIKTVFPNQMVLFVAHDAGKNIHHPPNNITMSFDSYTDFGSKASIAAGVIFRPLAGPTGNKNSLKEGSETISHGALIALSPSGTEALPGQSISKQNNQVPFGERTEQGSIRRIW